MRLLLRMRVLISRKPSRKDQFVSLDLFPQVQFLYTGAVSERELFIDNLLVRIHCIIVMIWWTGLALW